jgi:hypothetical protein
MNENKGLLTRLGETLDQYRAERRTSTPEKASTRRRGLLRWLGRQMIPNVGTLLLVVVLLLTVPSLAAPRNAPEATSTSTISYQGRLADNAGNPLTGYYNLEFRIYDDPVVGTPLWEEFWTGGNSVQVSDGLFNVMLGSINTGLAAAIEGHDELYLGITVGTDSEMAPRVQLGSVPFSMQAMTVPDLSITTAKIADGAVTQEKLAGGLDFLVEEAGSYVAQITVSEGSSPSVTPNTIELTYKRIGSVVFVSFPYSTLTISGSPHVMTFSLPFSPEVNNRGGVGDLTYSGGGQIGDAAGMMVGSSMSFRHPGAGFPNGGVLVRMGFWYIAAPQGTP